MDDELPEAIKKCLKILEENMDILSNLELDLEDQREDEIAPGLELHQLYDMTEDVAESAKLKRAEFNLMRRKAEDPQYRLIYDLCGRLFLLFILVYDFTCRLFCCFSNLFLVRAVELVSPCIILTLLPSLSIIGFPLNLNSIS